MLCFVLFFEAVNMAMRNASRVEVEGEVEEEENFGPQPVARLEVWWLTHGHKL